MSIRKLFTRSLLILLLIGLTSGVYYAWNAFPIITGYGAKNLCSCVLLAGRSTDDVIKNELGSFMLSLGSYELNVEDSSATATVFGLAKRKAIYRKGFGCTLVNEITEGELRAQLWRIPSKPTANQDTIPWPSGNKLPDSINLYGYDLDLLNKTVTSAFEEPGEEKNRRTRAILIVHDGQIIAEKYADGFDVNTRLTGWSMAKSLTNALIGILVKEGKLGLNDPAPIEEWKSDERNSITINNLMQASSGLKWNEFYGGPSDATNMLFRKKNAGAFASEVPLENPPGEIFYYSSGTTNILSLIIRQTLGDNKYHPFPYEMLFHKIGMNSMVMEPDPGGTFVGSSFAFAPARDWARFGLLYLNDGYWLGERILPEGWVDYTIAPAKGAKRGEYGAQFWLNAGDPNDVINKTYPDVPSDLFWADGFEGQNVFVLPSKNLVVVKLSLSTGNYLDDNQFLKEIIRSLPD
ncbi:MAG: beta-lactamase family protein [Cyclobacteriaceae bacterium]|nr:beta-lactamase family protein [Cyclobacteriaceae bacterium]